MTEFSAADIAQAGADGFRAGVASVRGGYDRELISLMLECPSDYTNEAVAEQASLLRMADNRDAAGVHTAKATPGDAEAVEIMVLEPSGFELAIQRGADGKWRCPYASHPSPPR